MDDDPDVFSRQSLMWQNIEQGQDEELDDADCYEIAYNLTGVFATLICLRVGAVLFRNGRRSQGAQLTHRGT